LYACKLLPFRLAVLIDLNLEFHSCHFLTGRTMIPVFFLQHDLYQVECVMGDLYIQIIQTGKKYQGVMS